MILIPTLPLDTQARELVDFCLSFQTVAGFVGVFDEKLSQLGGDKKYTAAAYEATEQLYFELFGRRRYLDREVFYCVLSKHRNR